MLIDIVVFMYSCLVFLLMLLDLFMVWMMVDWFWVRCLGFPRLGDLF